MINEVNEEYIFLDPEIFTSLSWTLFKLQKPQENKIQYAICQLCEKNSKLSYVTYCKTPSNLTEHLKRHHPGALEKAQEDKIKQQESKSTTQAINNNKNQGQTTITKFVTHKIANPNITYLLCQMIIDGMHPVSIVKQNGFQKLINEFDNTYQIPDKKTINKYLKNLYQIGQTQIKDKIQKENLFQQPICVIFDVWTSITQEQFIATTVQYIDTDWIKKNIFLEISPIMGSKAINIKDKLNEVLQKYRIVQDDLSERLNNPKCPIFISSDGFSSNKACFKFNQNKHIVCYCHILNNAIKDSFKKSKILSDLLTKIEGITSTVRQSQLIKNEIQKDFNQIEELKVLKSKQEIENQKNQQEQKQQDDMQQEDVDVEHSLNNLTIKVEKQYKPKQFKKIKSYSEIRWNSLYYTIESILYIKESIKNVFSKDKDLKLKNFSDSEWAQIEVINSLLKQIVDISEIAQQRDEITSSFVLSSYFFLKSDILQINQDDEKLVVEFKSQFSNIFTEKFLNNNEDTMMTLAIASYLDPRYRQRLLKEDSDLYKLAKQEIKEMIIKLIENNNDQKPVNKMMLKEEQNQNINKETTVSQIMFFQPKFLTQQNEAKNEMKFYEDYDFSDFLQKPVREFWISNKINLPRLSQIAKIYSTLSASSSEVERIFSDAGNIVSKKRNKLKQETIQQLLFVKLNKKYNQLDEDKIIQNFSKKKYDIA
ncbi:hypothetical protein ABPG72_013355 [Tetrahymena utriculariae]